jgi:hypothetical protein
MEARGEWGGEEGVTPGLKKGRDARVAGWMGDDADMDSVGGGDGRKGVGVEMVAGLAVGEEEEKNKCEKEENEGQHAETAIGAAAEMCTANGSMGTAENELDELRE